MRLWLLLFSLTSFALGQSDRTGWPKEINLGVVPVESIKETQNRYQPLADHLQKTLGIPVKLTVGADYAAVIVALQFKRLELAYLSPSAYVEAVRRANVEAFACEDTLKGGVGVRSVLVSRAKRGIKTLAQAKGKNFAFVDPQSTTGYWMPQSYFESQKLEPKSFFGHIAFSGSHEASIEGLVEGHYDLAVTSDQEVEVAIADGEIKGWQDLNVLWKSERLPTSPLAYRKDLPGSFKIALRQAVLSFKNPAALKQMRLKGFAAVSDTDYEAVRKLEKPQRTKP